MIPPYSVPAVFMNSRPAGPTIIAKPREAWPSTVRLCRRLFGHHIEAIRDGTEHLVDAVAAASDHRTRHHDVDQLEPSTGRVAGQHSMQAPDADQCQCQAQDETHALGCLLGVDAAGSKGFLFGRKYLGKGINVRLRRHSRRFRSSKSEDELVRPSSLL